jgi:hypothetical protein
VQEDPSQLDTMLKNRSLTIKNISNQALGTAPAAVRDLENGPDDAPDSAAVPLL